MLKSSHMQRANTRAFASSTRLEKRRDLQMITWKAKYRDTSGTGNKPRRLIAAPNNPTFLNPSSNWVS
jgi:hypothetical protein